MISALKRVSGVVEMLKADSKTPKEQRNQRSRNQERSVATGEERFAEKESKEGKSDGVQSYK
jgi:hypothetical protein